MMPRLCNNGIGDGLIDWLEQWLTDRRERVVVDGQVSNWTFVLSGVAQGSVLGHLVYLIYRGWPNRLDITMAD